MPFGEQPRYLFRDNDGIYGHGVGAFLICCGILEVRTAYRLLRRSYPRRHHVGPAPI